MAEEYDVKELSRPVHLQIHELGITFEKAYNILNSARIAGKRDIYSAIEDKRRAIDLINESIKKIIPKFKFAQFEENEAKVWELTKTAMQDFYNVITLVNLKTKELIDDLKKGYEKTEFSVEERKKFKDLLDDLNRDLSHEITSYMYSLMAWAEGKTGIALTIFKRFMMEGFFEKINLIKWEKQIFKFEKKVETQNKAKKILGLLNAYIKRRRVLLKHIFGHWILLTQNVYNYQKAIEIGGNVKYGKYNIPTSYLKYSAKYRELLSDVLKAAKSVRRMAMQLSGEEKSVQKAAEEGLKKAKKMEKALSRA